MDLSEVTYNQHQVICEHPRIIINPLLPELLCKYRVYVMRGQFFHNRKTVKHLFDFDYKTFSVKRNEIVHKDLDSCYVCDESTGETFPIYIEVPCNKCDICKERKVNALVQRCKFETCSYDSKPWFVTLTYDDAHLPFDGVSKRDAQLFLKRLRVNLQRAGYSFLIRYLLVSEYGKNTHRPHYHAIIWNINVFTTQEHLDISRLIDKSWSNGFIQHRLVDPANDKAFYYTAKYLKKDCVVPKGKNPTFCFSSRGKGGIGSRFIDSISDEVRRTMNVTYKFLNKWTNRVEEVVFSQYVLNRIFPSWHRSVPAVLRSALADFSLGVSSLWRCRSELVKPFIKKFHEYNILFSKYCFFGLLPLYELPSWAKPFGVEAAELARGSIGTIEKYKKIDFEKVQVLADKRTRFCERLFAHQQPVDIGFRAFRASRSFGLSLAREIL